MQIILPSHGNTLKILGKAQPSDSGYRFMTYVVTEQVEEGYLLFHTLTREMLLLTAEEYAHSKDLPELYEKWFLVPEEMDDMSWADQVRFVRRTVRKKAKNITGYTIFTTTDCNARCFYCYELGRSRIPMSEETAHRAASYIQQHCGGEKVRLRWFGGEPLFNQAVIDIICTDLRNMGIDYSSSMISNGYLFDGETIQRAVELWKLGSVQISLDGTEALYNRSKAYIYRDGTSPYQKVLDNIGGLMEGGVMVHIRLNMDFHNADNLPALVDELHERFGNNQKMRVYSHVLFEYAGNKPKVRAEEERRSLYAKKLQLGEQLNAYGWRTGRGLRKSLPVSLCMADCGGNRTILPDGHIGLCEHYSEDHFIGSLDSDSLDQAMVRQFQVYRRPQPECAACPSYPECIRLELCEETCECFSETRQQKMLEIRESMVYTYHNRLQVLTDQEEEPVKDC